MGTVLVVDDSEDLCRAVVALLKRHGHRAVCVHNGDDALAYLRMARADLVLLDLSMPGMDGFEVLREIRANQATSHLPVIVFSALSESRHVTAAREAGADAYWIKAQFNFDDFKGRVSNYMQEA